MITYLRTSLFHSPAQTLVNTVNTVGVMGKGIAKTFKERYPDMFREYKKLCDENALRVGSLHLWRGDTQWVLNFPTKTTWRQPSRIEFVHAGLEKFVQTYQDLGITSASFPPLGCGNGNLNWSDVRPVMENYLSKVKIPIYIHNIQVPKNFVPEHKVAPVPSDFQEFWEDIVELVADRDKKFETGKGRPFSLIPKEDHTLVVSIDGEKEILREEMIKRAYVRLRDALLVSSSFSSEREKRLKSYLFPVIEKLPYVSKSAATETDNSFTEAVALFVDRKSIGAGNDPDGDAQGCLFL